MNKNEILKKIGVIINELQEQYDYTELNKDDINDLELELFVANAHFLTDHLEILRKLNTQQINARKEEKPAPVPVETRPIPSETRPEPFDRYFEPVVQPFIKREIPPVAPVEAFVPEVHIPFFEPVIIVHETAEQEPVIEAAEEELLLEETNPFDDTYTEPEPEVVEQWINPEQEEEDETEEPEQIIEIEPEPEMIEPEPEYLLEAEYTPEPEYIPEPELIEKELEPEPIVIPEPEVYRAPVVVMPEYEEKPALTINQMISAQMAPRYGDSQELLPIKDLKSAINLNDKLLFVRDLFNGYSMSYGEAIEILNRFNKFDEADQFLKINYASKNNWEAKQDTADKFYALLRRRFVD